MKFNKKNIYGKTQCCCQKGKEHKNYTSLILCSTCNIIRARKIFKNESFCKRLGLHKTCERCQSKGEINGSK